MVFGRSMTHCEKPTQTLVKRLHSSKPTLSVGESTFKELGESGVGAASGLEKLTTSLTNLKNELLASGSILDGFFGTMADGIQAFRDSEVSALAQHLTDISTQLSKGVNTSDQERLLELYGKINDRLNELGYTVVNVNGEFQAVRSEMDNTAGSAIYLDAAENQLSTTTQRLGNDFISVTGGLSHFNANLQTVAGNVMTLTSVMSGFTGQINSIASGMVANLGAEGALGYAEDLTGEARTMAYQWMQAGIPLEQIQGILLPAFLADTRKVNSELYSTVKTLGTVNSEYNTLSATIGGIVAGATGPVAGVDANDFLPREDEVNENARRLADIMVNGIKGQPWLDEFKAEVPEIWKEIESSGDPQGTAARILKDFQDGLRPDLIDKGRAKELAKRALIGDKNTKALVDEIAGELAAEMGVSVAEARAAANSAMGVNSGGGGTTSATIKPKLDLSGIDGASVGAQLTAAVGEITLTPKITLAIDEPMLPENLGSSFATVITQAIAAGDNATYYSTIGSGIIAPLIATGLGSVDPQLIQPSADKFAALFMNSVRGGFVTAETASGENMMGKLGQMWAGMFTLSIASSTIGADVAGAIHQQISASVSLIESSGTTAGQNWRKGFMNEVMQIPGDTLRTLAMLVVPYVSAAINQEGGRTGAEGE